MSIEDLEHRAGEISNLINELVSDLIDIVGEPATNEKVEQATRVLLAARVIKDAIDVPCKLISAQNNLMKQIIVPKCFADHNVTTITLGGFRFSVSTRLSASIADKELGHQWLKDNGLGDLIKPTVNAQTLASAAKHLIEEGLELDPEIFNTSYVENTSITKV